LPTYDAEVLADSPLFYGKLQELSGTVLTDSSGNAQHGTYFSDVTFGLAGGVETISPSYACGGRVGYVPASLGSFLDLQNAFTWEGITMIEDVGDDTTIIARNSSLSFNGANVLGITNGSIVAEISFGGGGANTYTLSYGPLVPFAKYLVDVTRNAGVMLLYVNGILRAQRTDLPTGANTNGGGSYWHIGVSNNTTGDSTSSGNIFYGRRTSHVALYGTALSAGRILSHEEARRASLPLRATIVVNLSLELNTDAIVPTDLPFSHNYSDTFGSGSVPVVETLEYRTNTLQSEPDYQQRISARPHGALRTLEYHLSPKSGAARSKLQGALYTPGTFYCLPVWNDVGLTTAQANSGTSSISCDTTKRDYEALSYCGVCTDPSDPSTYQFFQLTSVADAALTLASTIGTTIPSGSYVFPARVCSISEDSLAVKSFAADHEDMVLRFEVIESELSTRRITTYTPSTTYKSIEVFTLESAKVNFIDERPFEINRRIQTHGRDYQYAMDTGSPQTFPVRFLLTSRSALSDFYGWLDARIGKLNPLWVSSDETDLTYAFHASGNVTVSSDYIGLYNRHHARRDLHILHTDGTSTNCRITNAVDNGNGTQTLSISPGIPAGKTVSKISFLKFCTLAADTIQLRHYKGNVSECGLSFRDLLTSPA